MKYILCILVFSVLLHCSDESTRPSVNFNKNAFSKQEGSSRKLVNEIKNFKEIAPDILEKNKITDLHKAILDNEVELEKVQELLSNESDINVKTSVGQTLLHILVQKKIFLMFKDEKDIKKYSLDKERSDKILIALLEKKPDVNLKDQDGNTPLHIAIMREDIKIVEKLLELDPTMDLENNEGKLFNEYLIKEEKKRIRSIPDGNDQERITYSLVDFSLIELLGKHNSELLDIKNKEGQNLVHILLQEKDHEKLAENLPKLLKYNSLGVNLKDLEGNTPIHFYMKDLDNFDDKNLKILTILKENKADLNLKDSNGSSALHLLLSKNYSFKDSSKLHEMIKKLISLGADISIKDNDDATPLAIAKIKGIDDTDILKSLEKEDVLSNSEEATSTQEITPTPERKDTKKSSDSDNALLDNLKQQNEGGLNYKEALEELE